MWGNTCIHFLIMMISSCNSIVLKWNFAKMCKSLPIFCLRFLVLHTKAKYLSFGHFDAWFKGSEKQKQKIFLFGAFKSLAPRFVGSIVLESCRSLGSNNVYLFGRRIYYASPILPKTYISNQLNRDVTMWWIKWEQTKWSFSVVIFHEKRLRAVS